MAASRLLIRPLGGLATTTPSNHIAVLSSRHSTLGRTTGGRPSPVVAACAPACVLPKTDKGLDLSTFLLEYVAGSMSHWRESITKPRPWMWGFNLQMFVEKGIVDCRFFTLLAIAGSLLASVLCFVEGCVLIMASYFQYFHSISQMLPNPGQVVVQLIEAIDMFLMGTAMLLFGMALHVMFVGQNNLKEKAPFSSHLSNNINLNKWSAMEAKSKMGRAVIMILQIQVLDKLKGIAVNNGADLACFAGVVFLSSASVFLLSRIRPTEAVR